jgi:hypothetical protein
MLAAGAAPSACGSSSSSADAGVPEGGVADALPPPPNTATCVGTQSACIFGTVATSGFTSTPAAAKVGLYHVYPYGQVSPITTVPVSLDGTFAFSSIAPWDHYYVQAVALFSGAGQNNAVATVVGPVSVPTGGASLALKVKPVVLEVLQQKPAGGQTTLAWASAHVYDLGTGAENTSATVSFSNGAMSWSMPYGKNVAGTMSYFAQIPANTNGGTAFTITTSQPAKTWNLVGEPATFDGSVTNPTSTTVPVGQALTVAWQAQPSSSYTVIELFTVQGMNQYTQQYMSPGAIPPDVTMEMIPASALSAPGMYLLNVAYSKATCPVTADGCVYNNSTVPVNLTAR